MPGITVDLSLGFDDAVDRVTAALADEGFGVISRIDIDEKFKEKLGIEFRPYAILGACNPALAHRALSAEPGVGLLLPCNVCVEQTDAGSRVYIVDAESMMSSAGLDDVATISELGRDASERLARVAQALSA
ncbi:MAG: DUF302 domain-containing protein [Pseudomonadota bacterium]